MTNPAKLTCLTALFLAASLTPASAGESATAKAVLSASGIKGGLCLHLGSGSAKAPALTAELAAGSKMLIHGLALDDAALARARKAIAAGNIAGRAMVEKLSGKKLPYLPNLARLIVVEDMAALSARGISKTEIMRVLAPGGRLCIASGGKWTSTTKPRPKTMDDWTHTRHGADGRLVSDDKAIAFPISLRWIDGTPAGRGGFGSCASCRAVALAGGRCFAVSVDDPGKGGAVLTARDAFSGLPLWNLECKGSYNKVQLDWRNAWPLVATAKKVYTRRGSKLIIVDAATGTVAVTCDTKYMPRRAILVKNTLLVACWEKMVLCGTKKNRFENDGIRSVWWPSGGGSLEAFDAQSGKPKWSLPLTTLTLVASARTAYALTHEGNPPTKREVVAIDIASGKEKWRVPHTLFGAEADTCLNFAGPDCAVISKTKSKGKREVFVLNEADGNVRYRLQTTTARSIVGKQLWCTNGRYDLASGKKVPGRGIGKTYAGSNTVGGCIPPVVVGGGRYVTSARRGSFTELASTPKGRAKRHSYAGARGACIMGMVPANGMFYTAQNNCSCVGAQPGGFLAIGPGGAKATDADFVKARPVEKGPAFGAAKALPVKKDDWPQYRQNSELSGGSNATLPAKLRVLWKQQLVTPGKGRFGIAWNSRIAAPQPLTAPMVVGGLVVVCGLDSGEVIARDAASGAKKWKTLLGSRIDTPPTYCKGLLLVGCHDGWVYALRATDGQLAYRVRIAPLESRMVAHGLVESVWPATGTVLLHNGIAYATAGRSTRTDGGIALLAFKPETGETVWARALGAKLSLLIDAVSMRKGELAFHWLRLDPATGKGLPSAQRFYNKFSMVNGAWSAGYGKRSGRGFQLGKACNSMMAWNDKLVAWGSAAVPRAKIEAPKPAGGKSRNKHPDRVKRGDLAWTTKLEPHSAWARTNSMALTGSTAIYAGSVYKWARTFTGCFLWIKSAKDGASLQKAIKLDSPAVYDGLAAAGGRVYLCLQNGELMCLGK
jgi:outer membrane protein assembly factor BamB